MCASRFCIVLVLIIPVCTGVDKTVDSYTSGTAVVDATVNKIIRSKVFPDDKLILRRIAYVESRDGTAKHTYNIRNGKPYFGGIWQVSKINFLKTLDVTTHPIMKSLHERLRRSYIDIDWLQTKWSDLLKPLYSGLAARLLIATVGTGTAIPRDISGQAEFWKLYYTGNKSRTSQDYIQNINRLEANKTCGHKQVDIIFCLDASGSVAEEDFKKSLEFVRNVMITFPVGNDKFYIGVIQYSTDVTESIPLAPFLDKDTLVDSVMGLPKISGGTSTGLAIQQMILTLQTQGRGDKGVAQVGILLTDGHSNVPTATLISAQRAKKVMTLYSVGIGANYNLTELESIASSHENVFRLDSFTQLNAFIRQITTSTCKALVQLKHVPVMESRNVSVTKNSVVTTNGTTGDNSPAFYDAAIPPNGLTFKVKTHSNKSAIVYVSHTEKYPNSAIHDYKTTTDEGGQVFIPPALKQSRLSKRSVEVDSARNVAYIGIFASTIGPGATKFEITLQAGNHVPPALNIIDDEHPSAGSIISGSVGVVLVSLLVASSPFCH